MCSGMFKKSLARELHTLESGILSEVLGRESQRENWICTSDGAERCKGIGDTPDQISGRCHHYKYRL